MHRHQKTLGLITARGGSESIPRKNIVELGGRPLIYYTIEAARKSELLTRTVVSSDDDAIIAVAKRHGADVPFVRPSELSQSTSTSIEVVQHALGWLKENVGETYDYVMLLQPTSPLRTARDIDECIRIAIDSNADSVMSVYEMVDMFLKKLKVIRNGTLQPWLEDEGKTSARRQEGEKVYKRNGAVYLTRASLLLQGDMFGMTSRPYVMPASRSVDINTLDDIRMAERLLDGK